MQKARRWCAAMWAALLLIVAAGLLTGTRAAEAERYPSRPITWIVPFAPGGQSDVEVRRLQPYLEKTLGVKIAVQYRVGGSGAIGWSELAKAKPDGYTVGGLVLPNMAIPPLVRGAEAGYRPDQIRAVVWNVGAPMALVVRNDSPFDDATEFIMYARSNPRRLTVGGIETYGPSDLTLALLTRAAGINLTYVPITGGAGPLMVSLLGGHVDAAIFSVSHAIRYADRTRVLAVAGRDRLGFLPGVPTFKELGYDVVLEGAWGVGVPAGTPDDVVAKLAEAVLEVMRMPEIQRALQAEGLTPLFMGPEESSKYLMDQTRLLSELVEQLRQVASQKGS